MVILNTSFHLLASREPEFVEWAENRYMAAAKASGLFDETLLIKILTEVDPQLKAYAVQLKGESLDDAARWHDDIAARLRSDLTSRYGEDILYFSTFMEIVKS